MSRGFGKLGATMTSLTGPAMREAGMGAGIAGAGGIGATEDREEEKAPTFGYSKRALSREPDGDRDGIEEEVGDDDNDDDDESVGAMGWCC